MASAVSGFPASPAIKTVPPNSMLTFGFKRLKSSIALCCFFHLEQFSPLEQL
jgi:hypothetical protein